MGNKSVLLTNLFVSQFTGSELDTLQTAKWFLDEGWDVEVATFNKTAPLLPIYEDAGIKVTMIPCETLSRNHYDLLWGHHWPVINHVVYHNLASFDKAIHCCMGPKEPLECAVPYHEYMSVLFAISEEVKMPLIEIDGVREENIRISPNTVEKSVFERYKPHDGSPLRSIGVVSNHIAPEVGMLKEQLDSLGIEVDYIGIERGSRLVDAQLLQHYDVIITIGRTVQQCFACGVPVYCYDIYGGPGYIDETNIRTAEDRNFSGRGFDRSFSAEQLASDICKRYREACQNTAYLHNIAGQRFSLEMSMSQNIALIETCREFDGIAAVRKYPQFMRPNDAFLGIPRLIDLNNELRTILNKEQTRISILIQEIKAEKNRNTTLIQNKEVLQLRVDSTRQELYEKEAQINKILHSRSYRLANKLSKIYNMFRLRSLFPD